ncbi:MAG: glycine/sarcosine/betaine reductase component B subunit [Chloroflexi bacterium]|nr:glycine/sarcosine/betaine reductase component B subunit [Chloroflexota bacterium]
MSPVSSVGCGRTHVLRGVALVEVNSLEYRYNKVIDMCGPGASVTPFSKTCNVVLVASPAPGVDRPAYFKALKTAGLRAGTYLAGAAQGLAPDDLEVYDLPGPSQSPGDLRGLPRVAYIYMLHSRQRPTEPDEPNLYGDNVRGLLPAIVRPNEILDGAVLCGYWNLGQETYTIQNHPVIQDPYAGHLKDLYFAGVIVTVAYPTRDERERTITADAVASVGIHDERMQLPAVGRAIGAAQVGPFGGGEPVPASSAIDVR